jgi:hemoglobin-like flavoprotein
MDIHESLHQILAHKQNVVSLFYTIFLERHPEARAYFRGVDLQHQADLLRLALIMIERHFTHHEPAIEAYLKSLGGKHHLRGIPEGLFPEFRDALLTTLEQFHGDHWGRSLAEQWRQALDRALEAMAEGYREPTPV